ncbi:MAG: hypothetical protein ACK5QC_12315, partial [Bacteroidota bacterium]
YAEPGRSIEQGFDRLEISLWIFILADDDLMRFENSLHSPQIELCGSACAILSQYLVLISAVFSFQSIPYFYN